ncbi:MAG: acyl carrier protein [Paludibacteraceae bacterium]|nr:acyl carrier protein [Paludibacteraceae bacterium]
MTENEIFEKLQNIFRSVMKNSALQITFETTPNDLAEWDSLAHAQLITEIESAFNVKFSLIEMLDLDNVSSIVKLLKQKIQ